MYPLYQKSKYPIILHSVASTQPHIIASSMSDSEKQHIAYLKCKDSM